MRIPLDSAKRGEQVISLYTRYLGGKQSLDSTVGFQYPYAYDPVNPIRASALWWRQSHERHHPHEGISLRASFEAFVAALSYDEYYGNWRAQNMPSTHVIIVNPYRRCKTSIYSYIFYLFFLHIINNHQPVNMKFYSSRSIC